MKKKSLSYAGLMVLFVILVAGLSIAIIWQMFIFVIGFAWPDAPDSLMNISYWRFAVAWIFFGIFFRLMRGGK